MPSDSLRLPSTTGYTVITGGGSDFAELKAGKFPGEFQD